MPKNKFKRVLRNSCVTLGILAAATLLCALLRSFDSGSDYVSMIFILGVFLVARFTDGYLYGIVSSIAGVLLVNFVFTYPYFEFDFTLAGYPLTILCMLSVSLATSATMTQAKQSERIRIEAEREKTRSNLLRAVSHDLRTPLTSILGATSAVIENDDRLTSQQRIELLTGAQEDAQWLIRMVENLLAVTRIDGRGTAQIAKTCEAAEEIVANTVAKFKKRFPEVRFVARAPQELLIVPMDAVLIQQVLANLLENAVVHGGSTTRVEISLRREGNKAVFEVQDDGNGIDPDRLPHIFDGSLSSDTEGKAGDHKRNMGIGLSVCSTIIRAHGGELHARNLEGRGAAFSFTLKLAEEQT